MILKANIKNLGKAGEIVKVSDGYARNFLFPSNKAVPASGSGLKVVKEQMTKKAAKEAQEREDALRAAKKLSETAIVIAKKASDDNKLFGSVAEADISAALAAAGYGVEKSSVVMEKHIKELGEYRVKIRLKGDISAEIKVKVAKEDEKKNRQG